MYKSRGLSAIFQLFGAASIQVCSSGNQISNIGVDMPTIQTAAFREAVKPAVTLPSLSLQSKLAPLVSERATQTLRKNTNREAVCRTSRRLPAFLPSCIALWNSLPVSCTSYSSSHTFLASFGQVLFFSMFLVTRPRSIWLNNKKKLRITKSKLLTVGPLHVALADSTEWTSQILHGYCEEEEELSPSP